MVPCRIMSYWFSYVKNRMYYKKMLGRALGSAFVCLGGRKGKQARSWTQLLAISLARSPYVNGKSRSRAAVFPSVDVEAIKNARKSRLSFFFSFFFPYLPLPAHSLLFYCLLTVLSFVYLQVCCDSRANNKSSWLSSRLCSALSFVLVLVRSM